MRYLRWLQSPVVTYALIANWVIILAADVWLCVLQWPRHRELYVMIIVCNAYLLSVSVWQSFGRRLGKRAERV